MFCLSLTAWNVPASLKKKHRNLWCFWKVNCDSAIHTLRYYSFITYNTDFPLDSWSWETLCQAQRTVHLCSSAISPRSLLQVYFGGECLWDQSGGPSPLSGTRWTRNCIPVLSSPNGRTKLVAPVVPATALPPAFLFSCVCVWVHVCVASPSLGTWRSTQLFLIHLINVNQNLVPIFLLFYHNKAIFH